jgi:hypothetical protein
MFFTAYKEATGFSKIKLWGGYIISMVIGEILTFNT